MNEQDRIDFLNSVFSKIAETYTTIVYMDTSDGKIYPIRLDEYSKKYEEIMAKQPSMHDLMELYAKETVYKDDIDDVVMLGDYAYVTERLKKEPTLIHIYRSIHNNRIVYYRLKIIMFEDGKKLLYGFENIDEQYRLQLEVKAERTLHAKILQALSREYLSVWYLDGKSRKVRLIQNNGEESENGEAVRIGSTMVDYHFSLQKYFSKYVSPDDFDRLMNETSYETVVKKAGDNDLLYINYIRINPDGTKSHFQVCYAKIDDDSGVANFVVGFRSTEGAIEE